MDVVPIHQIVHDEVDAVRFGDVLRRYLEDDRYATFYFAVAFVRTSGFRHLGDSLSEFVDRGGEVCGVVGVDNDITSREAVAQLNEIATTATIFNTTASFIFHPKVYLFESEDDEGVLVFGSGNLTRDGLFRNVEFGAAVTYDLTDPDDARAYEEQKQFVEALLDESHPNVQPIDADILDVLQEDGKLVSEEDDGGPEGRESTDPASATSGAVRDLFPPQELPDLPPPSEITTDEPSEAEADGEPEADGRDGGDEERFILQLSNFDSSHQPGTPGTPEVLIPMDAVDFFPDPTDGPHKHPDVYVDVELQTPAGPTSQNFRFWYYDDRREWRLNVKEITMEQVSQEGGSLLVISRDGDTAIPSFTVRVVNQNDDDFAELFEHCTREVGDKRWGLVR